MPWSDSSLRCDLFVDRILTTWRWLKHMACIQLQYCQTTTIHSHLCSRTLLARRCLVVVFSLSTIIYHWTLGPWMETCTWIVGYIYVFHQKLQPKSNSWGPHAAECPLTVGAWCGSRCGLKQPKPTTLHQQTVILVSSCISTPLFHTCWLHCTPMSRCYILERLTWD